MEDGSQARHLGLKDLFNEFRLHSPCPTSLGVGASGGGGPANTGVFSGLRAPRHLLFPVLLGVMVTAASSALVWSEPRGSREPALPGREMAAKDSQVRLSAVARVLRSVGSPQQKAPPATRSPTALEGGHPSQSLISTEDAPAGSPVRAPRSPGEGGNATAGRTGFCGHQRPRGRSYNSSPPCVPSLCAFS